MNTEFDTKYAHLILAMVNLQKGQRVIIRGEPILWDFYQTLSEQAYKQGASHVEVWPLSQQLQRIKVDYAQEQHLSYLPQDLFIRYHQALKENAVFIRVHTLIEEDVFHGVDSHRYAICNKQYANMNKKFLDKVMADECQWIVVLYPSRAWTQRVLGPTADLREAFELLTPILLGQGDDAVAWWKQNNKQVHMRAQKLTQLHIQTLHIYNEKTNLTFYLSERSQWLNATTVSRSGISFMCNLPSFEVFTTPDCRKTHGSVMLTRPVEINDLLVEDAYFEFEEGKVTSFSAKKGQEALRILFEDPGSRRIGEIALVDKHSPVARSRLFFYDTLVDENAAIHMAFGQAYIQGLEGGARMKEQQLDDIGFNNATYHSDVMIGDEHTQVEANCYDGRTYRIMESGEFVI